MSEITVYSTSWCGFCHQLKQWLKDKDIEFTEIDIEEDEKSAQDLVKATGQMGVPVTKINETYVVGFDRPKLEALLKTNSIS